MSTDDVCAFVDGLPKAHGVAGLKERVDATGVQNVLSAAGQTDPNNPTGNRGEAAPSEQESAGWKSAAEQANKMRARQFAQPRRA
jgi:hypothetical protein